jgi:hypothetical protein
MSRFVGCWICRVGERLWRFGGLAAETLLQCANREVTREQTICYPIRIFGDDQHGGDLPRVYVGRSGSMRKWIIASREHLCDRAEQKCPCRAMPLGGLNEQLIVLYWQASRRLFQYRGIRVRCSRSFAAPGMGQTNRRAAWSFVCDRVASPFSILVPRL